MQTEASGGDLGTEASESTKNLLQGEAQSNEVRRGPLKDLERGTEWDS